MKVYFACSITGGRENESTYQAIVAALLADGHEVPTAHLAESGIIFLEEVVEADEVYRRDVDWIKASDALIAEVSTPSHGVGYEIGYALNIGKPVLCSYREGVRVSKMILGNPEPRLLVRSHRTDEQAAEQARQFLLDLAGSKAS